MKATCLLFLVLRCYSLTAQQPSYINYELEDGLPSNTVYYALQDNYGYLWFGTDCGVSRFNGSKFVNYTYKDGLSENEVFDIFQDSNKRIWFSGFNGKPSFYLNGKFYGKELFSKMTSAKNKGVGLKSLEDQAGNVYYTTHEATFCIGDNRCSQISSEGYANSTLFYDEDSTVFLLSYSRDSVKILGLSVNRSYSVFKTDPTISPRLNTKALMVNHVVYFSNGNELVAVNLETKKIERLYSFEFAELLQCIHLHSENLLWLGTKNGLYIYNLETGEIEKKMFVGVSVSSVSRDREDNIWITSLNRGVFQIIQDEVEVLNRNTGLDFDNCIYLSVIDSSQVVIGSSDFRCAFIDQGNPINLSLPKHIGEGKIQSVKKEPGGKIYISTGSAFYRLDKNLKEIEQFLWSASDIDFYNGATVIAEGNRLLIANQPLTDLPNRMTDEFIRLNTAIPIKVKRIFRTSKRELFVTGSFGVRRIEGDSAFNFSENHLLNTNIVDFVETPDGLTWFASSLNGLIVCKDSFLFQLTTKHGLSSDFISALALDRNNSVWVGTQQGLACIKPDGSAAGYSIESFGKSSGLISEKVNDLLFFEDRLWVATDQGTCVFNYPYIETDASSPNLVIEGVEVNGHSKSLQSAYELSHLENRIKITYTGISMSSLENVTYLYRIADENADWVKTRNTELEYPSLETGTHVFEIKAQTPGGKESAIRRISFTILPAFYQTTWFFVLVVFCVLLVIFSVINLRIRKIKESHKLSQYLLILENEKLENENKVVEFNRNLAELEQKALMLHMNPHFIFNSINAINGFYAAGDVENAKMYVNRFSNLLRSILDFSQRKLISLREEVELLNSYLQLNQLRFNGKFGYEIKIAETINQKQQQIPPMVLQPFVENAIIHGIASLEKEGFILVKVEEDDHYLSCTVSDNGIGLNAAHEKNKNRLHQSTGIKISSERIRLYSDREDSLSIEESLDEKGAVTGTVVRFRFKKENLW